MVAPSFDYERAAAAIYRQSFARARAETRLDGVPADSHDLVLRLVHACGQPAIADDLAISVDAVASGRRALAAGAAVLVDGEMARAGIIRHALPAANPVLCFLDDAATKARAEAARTTRSAAAVDAWAPHLAGAVVAIGTAPTALFRLLELLAEGAPRPALIIGMPVGFVGAAESKAVLIAAAPAPFIALRGRLGGSALAAAAVNALGAVPPPDAPP